MLGSYLNHQMAKPILAVVDTWTFPTPWHVSVAADQSFLGNVHGLRQSSSETQVLLIAASILAASRRKKALAHKARWANARKGPQLAAAAKTTSSAPVKHTISAAGRRKIAAAQKARWAKLKAGKKAA
jgi:hypothetical protein